MALGYEAQRQFGISTRPTSSPAASSDAGRGRLPNTISASQARAARRRETLSHQQAVSAWLRELSGRDR